MDYYRTRRHAKCRYANLDLLKEMAFTESGDFKNYFQTSLDLYREFFCKFEIR